MDARNPFSGDTTSEGTDLQLVGQAASGSRDALEQLVRRHQGWIYNIAVRMVWDRHKSLELSHS